jgi:hypothetical protein
LYLNDTSQGIFVFDNTGTFKKQIPIPHIDAFYMKDNILYYLENNDLYSFNQLTFEKSIYTNLPPLAQLKVGRNILCGINQEGFVEIWEY